MSTDEFSNAQVVIPDKFYWLPLRNTPAIALRSPTAARNLCFSVDDVLLYEPFFTDFGPLNLGKAYRFCRQVQQLLKEGERTNRRVYYFCSPHVHHKANAAVLIGLYQVLILNRSAEEVCNALAACKPYAPFRDASCGAPTFHLTVFHCIKGAQKARDVGFLDWSSSQSTWSNEEYEHYEQVENGDLNWVVPGKLVAFSGPAARDNEIPGYRLHTPEDYWDYFRKMGVTAIVRLNKKVYDRKRFTDGGFNHYDLYFPDGSCPREPLLLHFLELAEAEPGALAVHCKAGLGRTGVLLCCYMMKHFKFSAEEVIGYIRLCRPGSVIGPQQNFLCDVQSMMWAEGDLWRSARGINKPHLVLQDVLVNSRGTPHSYQFHPPASKPHGLPQAFPAYSNSLATPTASVPPVLNAAYAPPTPFSATSMPPSRGPKPYQASGWGWGGSTPTSTTYNNNNSSTSSRVATNGIHAPAAHQPQANTPPSPASAYQNNGSSGMQGKWGVTGNGIAGGPVTPSVPRPPAIPSPADLSLAQHSTQIRRSFNGLTVQVPPTSHSNPSSANSTPSSAKLGPSTAPANAPAHARGIVTPRPAAAARSSTPQRFSGAKPSSASSQPPTPNSASFTPNSFGDAVGYSPPTPPSTGSMRGNGSSILSGRKDQPGMARSSPVFPLSSFKRSPSADLTGARANDLRSTLHTDTLRAASRPRHPMPERSALSADVSRGFGAAFENGGSASTGHTPTSSAPMDQPWGHQGLANGHSAAKSPVPPSNPISTTPTASGPAPRSMHARTLAPNGQPRKVPIPLLSQFHAGMVNQSAASHKSSRMMGVGNARSRPSLELKNGSRGSGMGGLATPDQARRANAVAQMRHGLSSK